MQNANTRSDRPQADLFRSNIDFFQMSMASARQWMDMQTRTFASLTGRQAEVANQYLNGTMEQLRDPQSFADPYTYFTRQSDILKAVSQRTMDGFVEVAQETVDLLTESRNEMNRMMEELSASAEKSIKDAQVTARDISNTGVRAVEKMADRTVKADDGRHTKAR